MYFIFFLMARNAPTEFRFKRGGEWGDSNMKERGREGGASRGRKFPMVSLPASDNQHVNEVNVRKKKWCFLPDHQDLEGELDEMHQLGCGPFFF